MSHAFSAKPTFGTLKEQMFQSDYITRKKSKNTFCANSTVYSKVKQVNSYETLNSFNLGICLNNYRVLEQVNKYNLISAQYSKFNLNNVCTVSKGAPPSKPCNNENPCDPCQNNDAIIIDTLTSSVPFYWGQTIDPLGELFGKSQCGELNYTKYMVVEL